VRHRENWDCNRQTLVDETTQLMLRYLRRPTFPPKYLDDATPPRVSSGQKLPFGGGFQLSVDCCGTRAALSRLHQ
jgi:hypothetical protein